MIKLQKILLVDDDADDTGLFMEALEEIDTDITCTHASDGQEALDKLSGGAAEHPDIIFLDINMPGMNGWQCLTALKNDEAVKDVPVIMYSTSSENSDMEKARRLGALGFLSKPDDYDTLKKALLLLFNQKSLEELSKCISRLRQ